jgi:hypothetical protein
VGEYTVFRDVAVQPLPQQLVEMLTPKAPEIPVGRVQRFPGYMEPRANAYLGAALRRIEEAPERTRNQTLFGNSVSIARLTSGGHYDEEVVRDCLLVAGTRTGLSERECLTTIESAFEYGLSRPRNLFLMPDLSASA